jgi:LGFP repeat
MRKHHLESTDVHDISAHLCAISSTARRVIMIQHKKSVSKIVQTRLFIGHLIRSPDEGSRRTVAHRHPNAGRVIGTISAIILFLGFLVGIPGTASAGSVRGAIAAKYWALGGPARLGWPASNELTTPDGRGRYNFFTGRCYCAIYWTPWTGAREIEGTILSRWGQLGYERGMGYPWTDESPTPHKFGRFNHFSGGGSIYWSPSTGAHPIWGTIKTLWANRGWENSTCGFPTSAELVDWSYSNGSRWVHQTFEGVVVYGYHWAGRIDWSWSVYSGVYQSVSCYS